MTGDLFHCGGIFLLLGIVVAQVLRGLLFDAAIIRILERRDIHNGKVSLVRRQKGSAACAGMIMSIWRHLEQRGGSW